MEGVIVTIGVIMGGTWINLVIIHTKHFSNVTIYLLELFIILFFTSTLVFLLLTSCSGKLIYIIYI